MQDRPMKRTTANALAVALGFSGEPIYGAIVVSALAGLSLEHKMEVLQYMQQWFCGCCECPLDDCAQNKPGTCFGEPPEPELIDCSVQTVECVHSGDINNA